MPARFFAALAFSNHADPTRVFGALTALEQPAHAAVYCSQRLYTAGCRKNGHAALTQSSFSTPTSYFCVAYGIAPTAEKQKEIEQKLARFLKTQHISAYQFGASICQRPGIKGQRFLPEYLDFRS